MSLNTFKNPSEKALTPEALDRGMDVRAVERLVFRVNHIEEQIDLRRKILSAGNIARLEHEISMLAGIVQDLADIVREAVTLKLIDFRQEQGLISPPNTPEG